MDNGHYWAIIKDDTTNRWFSWNDRLTFKIKAGDVNNKTYVFFYVRK